MIDDKCERIKRLIEAGHILFEVIEERDLPYQVLRLFIENGLQGYEGFDADLEKLENSVDNWIDYNEIQKNTIKTYIQSLTNIAEENLLGHLSLVFLLAWNMNRFYNCNNLTKENLEIFGEYLNNKLRELINSENFKQLKEKSIVNIEWEEVKPILEELNKFLKNKPNSRPQECFKQDNEKSDKQNEWVGAFKLGHVLLPKVIIPIDNPIAEALCFKNPGESFKLEIYEQFWEKIKDLLKKCPELIADCNILKKIDELFYVLFSLREKVKWKIQEEFFGKEEDEIRNDLKLKRLIERIKNCFPIKKIQKISNKIMLIFDYDNKERPIHISLFEFKERTYITIDIGFSKEDFNKSNKSALIQCIAKDLKLKKRGPGFKIGTLEEDEEKIFSRISKFLTKYFEISQCF